ncbi:zinc ABC transporter substrate-binding protein [Vibrio sp.]|uniref:High-affinity zinc uptake system protein ZnuA n=1 Tax=Vibrio viridaestus TaxID=2487322 RepID=A0A3N9TK09_9VIBR|nr:zinc ABC transporter substrate-binding protein [Vibrio viridaestus]MDC0611723.1 zinc ABC transporter substrate-binding protein [Vibrio sp.]RQW64143.1 zinc ABC transporter substrate-binding protein ZnuA [Vibrio viridaestus]
MLFRSMFVIAFVVLAKSAFALNVLTTIKPIQMITYELTQGVTVPEVLLSSTASPHDYALKPSDIKKINQADLIVWFGEGLEPFLKQIVAKQDGSEVITLSQLPNVNFHQFGEEHHDDGHHHGTVNPHFWLGPDVTQQVAVALVEKLKEVDPEHSAQYDNNLSQFVEKLNSVDKSIETRLKPVANKPYFVFHDAYGYFEEHYGLDSLGHFTVSPERKPGAKTLVHIRSTLNQYHNVCIFAEPQFTPAIIESVTRGTDAKIGHLDPLGTDIEVKAGSYFSFLNEIATQFEQCLK